MRNVLKVFLFVFAITVLSCGSVFAANADIEFTFKSKDYTDKSDVLKVAVDGKHLFSLSEAEIRIFEVKTNVQLENRPYDIAIEHTKDGQTKTYHFKGNKMHDVDVEFYYDGKTITQIE